MKQETPAEFLVCKICKKEFKHLGSHIWHKHKILAKQYKEDFGLPYCMALIAPSVQKKKQKAFAKHREKYLANLEKGGIHRYRKKRRISKHEAQNATDRIHHYNRKNLIWEPCPVCGARYKNLNTHLRLKHNLKRI